MVDFDSLNSSFFSKSFTDWGCSFFCCLPQLLNMQTSNLAHFSDAPVNAAAQPRFTRPLTALLPGLRWLSGVSLAIATIGLGVTADRGAAQVVYFERPVSVSVNTGVVSTNSGIGLNVRSGPGLRFPVIGGADDGNFMPLVGETVFSDGYAWRRVATGGWAASDFVSANGTVNVSWSNGNCWQACGGDSQPIDRPISVTPPMVRPPISAPGPYVAAVPGGQATLNQVRRYVPSAQLDRAREGSFVNAGNFATHDGAQALASYLRTTGFDARVIYGR